MSLVRASSGVAVLAGLLVSAQHAGAQCPGNRCASARPALTLERQLQSEVSAATADVARRLLELEQTVQKRPAQVNPSRWTTILAGAEEVKCKAAVLKVQRHKVKAIVLGLAEASGRLRTGLAGLDQKFLSLADQAQAEADGTGGQPALPEQLRAMVQREVTIYRDASSKCKDTGAYLSSTLANSLAAQKQSIALLDQCGPMLDRLEEAAGHFIVLAKIGQEVEESESALEGFADQINGVLDLFEQLNSTTKEAISKVSVVTDVKIATSAPTLEKTRPREGASSARPAEVVRGTTVPQRAASTGTGAYVTLNAGSKDGVYRRQSSGR